MEHVFWYVAVLMERANFLKIILTDEELFPKACGISRWMKIIMHYYEVYSVNFKGTKIVYSKCEPRLDSVKSTLSSINSGKKSDIMRD